jgi:hypothetical protein
MYPQFMNRLAFLFPPICVALAFPCLAQTADSGNPAGLAPIDNILSFEDDPAGQVPYGWSGGPTGTVVVDDTTVVHDGQRCVRIDRKRTSEGYKSDLIKTLPMGFSGKKIELRGFIRTEKVSGWAGLWMREDKNGTPVEFDNMFGRQLGGTTDWKEYSITLRISPVADQLTVGAQVSGSGRAWISGLRLYVDGKLFSPAPAIKIPTTLSTMNGNLHIVESFTRKPVTVQQLEGALAAGHGKSDAELADRLAGLGLTERLSRAKLATLKAGLPGQKSSVALVALADESAFLEPPTVELPAAAPPDITELRRILALALDYLEKTVPKLPNFFATRITDRYDQSLPKELLDPGGINGIRPWRATGSDSATVYYRNGAEVVDTSGLKAKKIKKEDKGLFTRGVFGPTLSTVLGDSLRNGLTWSHWEQGASGLEAVFHYVVPKARSHYELTPHSLDGKDGGNALNQATGYHGEIEIDPASGTIHRLTLQGDIEPGQSILRGDIMVEYGPVEIAEKTYTCPLRSVSLSVASTLTDLMRSDDTFRIIQSYATMVNDVVFKGYHVFRSEIRLLPADESAP